MLSRRVLVEHHGILEGGAEREAGAPEPRDVVHAAEGPGAGDLAAEAFRAEIERIVLAADHGIGEVDLDLGAEAVGIGAQFAEGIADRDLHRLQDLDETAGGGLGDDAGLIDGGDEGSRAAVHDRNFGAVDFDGGVVDAHAAQAQRAHVRRWKPAGLRGRRGRWQIRWRSRIRRSPGTSRSASSRPVRTKIKPASTGAGPSVRLTGKPE